LRLRSFFWLFFFEFELIYVSILLLFFFHGKHSSQRDWKPKKIRKRKKIK
jgi:hypothetical protein